MMPRWYVRKTSAPKSGKLLLKYAKRPLHYAAAFFYCLQSNLRRIIRLMRNPRLNFCFTAIAGLLLSACQQDRTQEYLAEPKVGDVLVVQFNPNGAQEKRYYLYRVRQVTPDSVYLNPAAQDVASPDADVKAPGTFVGLALRSYSRAELPTLLKEDPSDIQHSKLVKVRREN
jgi:hypothetical protein